MTDLNNGWECLIEACKIFSKYNESRSAFHCSLDELTVNVDPHIVSQEDRKRLEVLGFHCDDDGELRGEDDHFYSFRFGSY